jgi:hypothetical protein
MGKTKRITYGEYTQGVMGKTEEVGSDDLLKLGGSGNKRNELVYGRDWYDRMVVWERTERIRRVGGGGVHWDVLAG